MKGIWSQRAAASRMERDILDRRHEGPARPRRRPIPADAIKDYERVQAIKIDLAAIDGTRTRHAPRREGAHRGIFRPGRKRQFIHLGLTSRDLTENVEQLQILPASLKLVQFKAAAALLNLLRGNAPRQFRDADDHRPHAQRARAADHPRQAPRHVRPGNARSPTPAARGTRLRAIRCAGSRAPSARSSTSSPCSAATPTRSTSSKPHSQAPRLQGLTLTAVGQVYPRSLDFDTSSARCTRSARRPRASPPRCA